MREKLVLAVSSALVLVLSAACFLTPAIWSDEAQAAKPSKEDKLRIDNLEYDWSSQRFVIDLSCQSGMAQENKNAEVMVGIEVVVSTGISGVGDVSRYEEYNITKQAGATKDSDGKVQLEPQYIAWDRDIGKGPRFTGSDVPVVVKVVLIHRNGKNLGNVVTKYQEIDITAP